MEKEIKHDILDRNDVDLLVRTFYSKIREHETLGPIFDQMVMDWESHFELLTDFWESQLFLAKKYKGNPIKVHQAVDKRINGTLTMEHFGQWLNLWLQTLDQLFEGERAWIAKNRARKIATMLYVNIFENRMR